MSITTLNRRSLIAGFAASLATIRPVFAINTNNAQVFVEKSIGDLERIVNSGKSGVVLEADVRRFFNNYAEVSVVARTVIGAPWRGMSSAQRRDYIRAFEGYVVRKYSKQFGVFKGGKASVSRVRQGGSGVVYVNMEFRDNGPVQRLDVQVSDASGKPKIMDLSLEGLSLIGTERGVVRSLLAKSGNDIDRLIKALNARS